MPIASLVQGRLTEQLRNAVAADFEISALSFDHAFPPFPHAVRLEGVFLRPTEVAYDAISARAAQDGFLIFFRREAGQPVIYAVQAQPPKTAAPPRRAILLFFLTLISVFITGGLMWRASPEVETAFDWQAGLSYALPLMTILLAHELGHFLVARRNRMAVSPPYFIPLPLIGFGTLGAVIAMLAPPKNRRQLLQMAAAGPLAGLIFAIPILIYGLSRSEVGPIPPGPVLMEGNSLFYLGLKWLMFGQILPSADGIDVSLSIVAFAGWMGLLVTALNLIPAGQLDGGHALFTLFGQRVRPVTYLLIGLLAALALITQFWGWLIWAGLLYLFGRVYAVPMDDLTPLDRKHKLLAAFMLLLFVLLFMLNPLRQLG